MPDAPIVSVLIPTHQRRAALQVALESLARQTVEPGSYEVIVATDACSDGTQEMIDALAVPYSLRRVEPEGRGRSAAVNTALAAARGEVAIVLDDDMRVVPGFVERHRAHHPSGSRRCVLGAVPVGLDAESTHAARYVKAKFDSHLARLSDPAHLALPRSFFTGNASVRMEVLSEVGGFDESFGIYGNEDVELSLRLRKAGVELGYDPEAKALQEYGKDLKGLQRDTLAKGRTTVMLARSHPEFFADLRLADPYDASRPWLVVRALLLWLTRRLPATAAVAFAFFSLLESAGFWRLPLFYRPVLDYAFWAGVDATLRESNDEGELSTLSRELQRGPIDLLLQR
jgi:GT2 family glycosyltransferase